MSSAAVGTHSSGAGPLSLMSCVRESSPPQDFDSDNEKCVASKRRFWNPKRWFRRKAKVAEDAGVGVVTDGTEIGKDALRSRSTSELSVADEDRRRSSSSMHPGLSVSHDSVFHSPNSGSDMDLDAAQSSSSLSISQPIIDLRLQTELSERLRLRRSRGDTSEDDEGLPRSPCNSPTASDGLLRDKTANKDLPTKSHSTCSDGSLLSMGSYEDDVDFRDPFGPQSRYSSKLSLHENKPTSDSSFEFETSSVPLNHSAAHHRVSIKPKKTHGPPRRKRVQQLAIALPATPEVNEDSSIRSLSPEISRKETLTELYSMNATRTVIDTQIKCSSLPPGLTAPGAETGKLNRSKSNAGSKSHDHFSPLHEDEKEEKLSLFDRIFPRKSGRKKKKEAKHEAKAAEEDEAGQLERRSDTETLSRETTDSATSHSHAETSRTLFTTSSTTTSKAEVALSAPKPVPAPRSGAASRQRVLPVDLPETPDEDRREAEPSSPEKCVPSTSPLQVELENRFRKRQISLSTSPTSVPIPADSPPLSPRSPKSPKIPRIPETQILPTVISSFSEHTHFVKSSSVATRHTENRSRSEDFKCRIKMPGLSSLQQRALTLNEDESENYKSLTDFAENKSSKPLAKSHSFKEAKNSFNADKKANSTATFLSTERAEESKNKAASLDSIKHLDDEPVHLSELKFELKKSRDQSPGSVLDNISDSLVTISGPSHASIVNITSNKEGFSTTTKSIETGLVDGSRTISIKENQVSVTKIQVEQKSTQVTQSTVPEFVNKQLHKVEVRPTSNIILSIKSPKLEEPARPKTLFSFDAEPDISGKPPAPRKFSKENLEIVEKEAGSPPLTPQANRFKKNDSSGRKSSTVSITPDSPVKEKPAYSRSVSLDSLDSDKSSQDSLDKLDEKPAVLRRKSAASRKRDEEPELMKVFARRSLKLKDSDVEALQESLSEHKTRDSDKENRLESPADERKRAFGKASDGAADAEVAQRRRSGPRDVRKEDWSDGESAPVKPLTENVSPRNGEEGSPVLLRRTFNSNIFIGQRAFSVNPAKTVGAELIVKKQPSFSERRRTDQWMTNIKNEEEEIKDRVESDIISNITPRGDFITEPKNFSQRKAEWEQRAQLAKKTAH